MDIIKNNITKILNKRDTYYTCNKNNVWKLFGSTTLVYGGVRFNEGIINKPTTFYEDEIFEWKFYNYAIFIRLKNNTWKSFGCNYFGH